MRARAGTTLYSYSALKSSLDTSPEPRFSFETKPERREESSGSIFGNYVHELMELIPLESFDETPLQSWKELPEVTRLAASLTLRYALLPQEGELGLELCYRGYNTPLESGELRLPGGLKEAKVRSCELEFFFPTPTWELTPELHPKGPADHFMKGFIDLIFEWEGRLYVLDWKTDSLENYSEPHLRSVIESRYALQAKIYGAAIVRQEGLDEKTYASRFGGLLYAFLRGFSSERAAVVHFRPSFGDYGALIAPSP